MPPQPAQGHHFSGQPPRRPMSPRQGPPSAAQQRIDRIAAERGTLRAADGQARKPRPWHIAVAVTFALVIVASIAGSGLLGLGAFASGVAAAVLGFRRSRAVAKHLRDVQATEHFIRSVPLDAEDFAADRELRRVVDAGRDASIYLVHERLYIGAADGQAVMNRAVAYRDAAQRASAEWNRRYPTVESVYAGQEDAPEPDDIAEPELYENDPDEDEDDDVTATWRDDVANNDDDWN